ncbi:hypothetical protein CR203_14315 [Salipaludibacillus neizhouensis]|uniref:Uncharacterized protein n=1 Tax=Salipaludibacillus neizhouensis TaxID=885475 RepID=A0A3A9K7H9_9BACI|nr:hypothetical protein [Salipaludibacillus neizhouensis]RKL66472.1 hypothetical protein CR203_14315 [Salipaludibacillus neizhouensis]
MSINCRFSRLEVNQNKKVDPIMTEEEFRECREMVEEFFPNKQYEENGKNEEGKYHSLLESLDIDELKYLQSEFEQDEDSEKLE